MRYIVLFSRNIKYCINHLASFLPSIIRNRGMDTESRKLKCISKRVVSWYQGLNQVRQWQVADNCNHNINIGVGPRAAATLVISLSDVKILHCRLTIFWFLKQTNSNIESSLCEKLNQPQPQQSESVWNRESQQPILHFYSYAATYLPLTLWGNLLASPTLCVHRMIPGQSQFQL